MRESEKKGKSSGNKSLKLIFLFLLQWKIIFKWNSANKENKWKSWRALLVTLQRVDSLKMSIDRWKALKALRRITFNGLVGQTDFESSSTGKLLHLTKVQFGTEGIIRKVFAFLFLFMNSLTCAFHFSFYVLFFSNSWYITQHWCMKKVL